MRQDSFSVGWASKYSDGAEWSECAREDSAGEYFVNEMTVNELAVIRKSDEGQNRAARLDQEVNSAYHSRERNDCRNVRAEHDEGGAGQ